MTSAVVTTPAVMPPWALEAFEQMAKGLDALEQNIRTVATVYVAALDRDSRFSSWFRSHCPRVPLSWLRKLEQIGRGLCDERLLTEARYSNRLIRLPLADQRRALDGTLEVLTSDGSGLQVTLDAMTPDMARQVFAVGHVRTLEEQRAWLETARQTARTRALGATRSHDDLVTFDRKRNVLIIAGPVTLTAADLIDYVKRLSR